ncbi:DNA mismatch repair protein msh6 [Balamuthia mandrillaris]
MASTPTRKSKPSHGAVHAMGGAPQTPPSASKQQQTSLLSFFSRSPATANLASTNNNGLSGKKRRRQDEDEEEPQQETSELNALQTVSSSSSSSSTPPPRESTTLKKKRRRAEQLLLNTPPPSSSFSRKATTEQQQDSEAEEEQNKLASSSFDLSKKVFSPSNYLYSSPSRTEAASSSALSHHLRTGMTSPARRRLPFFSGEEETEQIGGGEEKQEEEKSKADSNEAVDQMIEEGDEGSAQKTCGGRRNNKALRARLTNTLLQKIRQAKQNDNNTQRKTTTKPTTYKSKKQKETEGDEEYEEEVGEEDEEEYAEDETSSKSFSLPSTPSKNNKQNKKTFRELHESWLAEHNIRDAQQRPPSDPNYDPSTLYIPERTFSSFNSFQRQYWSIKRAHWDKLVFFKCGAFWELYERDADIVGRELDLKVVTTGAMGMRTVGWSDKNDSFTMYAAKLIGLGFKVVRVDQSNQSLQNRKKDIKTKGKAQAHQNIITREITQVLTQGTLVDAELLDRQEASYLLALKEREDKGGAAYGVCFVDASTGRFFVGGWLDDEQRTQLETLLLQVKPKEIVYEKMKCSAETRRAFRCHLDESTPLNNLDFPNVQTAIQFLYSLSFTTSTSSSQTNIKKEKEEESELPSVLRELVTKVEEKGRKAEDEGVITASLALEAFGGCLNYLKGLYLDKELLSQGHIELYHTHQQSPSSSLVKREIAEEEEEEEEEMMNDQPSLPLIMDGKTLLNLEIFENNSPSSNREEGTLWRVINHCRTPFGKRLLRQWLCYPLQNVGDIEDRLNAVEDLNRDNQMIQGRLATALHKLPDLERMLSRIHAGKSNLKAFLAILDGFNQIWSMISQTKDILPTLTSKRLARLLTISSEENKALKGKRRGLFPDVGPLLEHFERAFYREEDQTSNGDKRIKIVAQEGADPVYDAALQKVRQAEQKLEDYLEETRKKLDLKKGELNYVTVRNQNYLLELSSKDRAKVKKLPEEFVLIAETKNVGRYSTPTRAALVHELEAAKDELAENDAALLERNMETFDRDFDKWSQAVSCVAELDALCSLAMTSTTAGEQMCRPRFVASPTPILYVRQMTHPCIQLSAGEEFIPNDLIIGDVSRLAAYGDDAELKRVIEERENDRCDPESVIMLLTGPNMGGKSTLLRQTCILVIMAQMGCYVPASACYLTAADRIFTRVGANDNIMGGQSTFMVELQETARILRHATSRSLVILDELGRGTSTFDGYSIAYAVLKDIAERVGCRTLFSTHYHALTNEVKSNSDNDDPTDAEGASQQPIQRVSLHHMSCYIDPQRKDVTFLYKVQKGVCPKSYGMNVARMAGVVDEVVESAERIAARFEAEAQSVQDGMSLLPSSSFMDLEAEKEEQEEPSVELSTAEQNIAEELLRLCQQQQQQQQPKSNLSHYSDLIRLWSSLNVTSEE